MASKDGVRMGKIVGGPLSLLAVAWFQFFALLMAIVSNGRLDYCILFAAFMMAAVWVSYRILVRVTDNLPETEVKGGHEK